MTAAPPISIPPISIPPLSGALTPGPTTPTGLASADLVEVTRRIRGHIVNMCAGPTGGHLGGSLSLVEILTALYFRVLRIDPALPDHPGRDVLVLSKGHGGVALYATLAEAGYFDPVLLERYGHPDSHFLSHPHPEVAGVEVPTGSLGHGLALGVGYALAHRLAGSSRRCFVVMGDGELQEGSVWEAAAVAAHHRLDRLVAVIDRNQLQITGGTETVCTLEPLADRWRAFGWAVHEVDGHTTDAIADAITIPGPAGRPTVVIAHTVKGKGVPAAENKVHSHFARLGDRQRRQSLAAVHRTERSS